MDSLGLLGAIMVNIKGKDRTVIFQNLIDLSNPPTKGVLMHICYARQVITLLTLSLPYKLLIFLR